MIHVFVVSIINYLYLTIGQFLSFHALNLDIIKLFGLDLSMFIPLRLEIITIRTRPTIIPIDTSKNANPTNIANHIGESLLMVVPIWCDAKIKPKRAIETKTYRCLPRENCATLDVIKFIIITGNVIGNNSIAIT